MPEHVPSTLNSKQVWQQLMLLRDHTKMSGTLHEAQVLQLRMWVRLAIPNVVAASMSWEAGEAPFIRFDVETKGTSPMSLNVLLAGMDRSVKDLLGPEWELVVYGRKLKMFSRQMGPQRLLFRGPREVPSGKAHQAPEAADGK